MKIVYLESTGSTNSYVREADEEMTLVYAGFQTEGRGQRGNRWESEPGKNLPFSFVLKPVFLPAERQFELSMLVSVAIAETLDAFGAEARIKWPNDIYVGDRKICGILIENDVCASGMLARSVVGAGINVNQTVFRSDAPNPTSLKLETGEEIPPETVLRRFATIFEEYYALFAADAETGIGSKYLDRLYRKDRPARYRDASGEFTGVIRGTGEYGMLRVEKPDGSFGTYSFKEIVYL